jgi:adenylate kinase family enzyme
MERICVIGVTGSGKSTVAAALAQRLDLPLVELDALHWDPNWTEAPSAVFLERVRTAVSGKRWVVDGNYSIVRGLTVERADTIIWLDLPFFETFRRLLARTLHRYWSGAVLWNGNRERLRTQFFSRDSILLWCISSYPRRQREYPVLLEECSARGQTTLRLRSQREIDRWLLAVDPPGSPEAPLVNAVDRRGM